MKGSKHAARENHHPPLRRCPAGKWAAAPALVDPPKCLEGHPAEQFSGREIAQSVAGEGNAVHRSEIFLRTVHEYCGIQKSVAEIVMKLCRTSCRVFPHGALPRHEYALSTRPIGYN